MGDWDFSEDTDDADAEEEQAEEEEVEEEEPVEEQEPQEFAERFAQAVRDGDPGEITTTELYEHKDELGDSDILREALELDDRSTAQGYYEERLDEVTTKAEKAAEDEDQAALDEVTDEEPEEEESDERADGSEEDDVSDEEEEFVEELDEEEVESVTETGTEQAEPVSSGADGGGGVDPIDTTGLTSNAMTAEEAAQKEHTHRILVWGPPGLFKTHFAYTMPEPVCLIDTEGKAHDIAHKFEDKVTYIFQPENFEEAQEALDDAIAILEKYRREQDVIGTIAVDSMSIMWEWAQLHYMRKWMPQADSLEEARENFDSAMSSQGPGDWQKIKQYHNESFREVMLNTDFHIVWTAMSTEDYGAVMEEGLSTTPMKPDGEKNNKYKVDHIIRGRWDDEGRAVGDLEKSGLVRQQYRGLVNPTFEKHQRVIGAIEDIEENDDDVQVLEMEDGTEVEITQGVTNRG